MADYHGRKLQSLVNDNSVKEKNGSDMLQQIWRGNILKNLRCTIWRKRDTKDYQGVWWCFSAQGCAYRNITPILFQDKNVFHKQAAVPPDEFDWKKRLMHATNKSRLSPKITELHRALSYIRWSRNCYTSNGQQWLPPIQPLFSTGFDNDQMKVSIVE